MMATDDPRRVEEAVAVMNGELAGAARLQITRWQTEADQAYSRSLGYFADRMPTRGLEGI
jgi:hypothetical protein